MLPELLAEQRAQVHAVMAPLPVALARIGWLMSIDAISVPFAAEPPAANATTAPVVAPATTKARTANLKRTKSLPLV